ncbi:MAG: tetratricopeptide repeat protein, partial [Planctomycetia bacterium]|nr:tetratricopeptide repeat protein [Planctomycetia bacterium]
MSNERARRNVTTADTRNVLRGSRRWLALALAPASFWLAGCAGERLDLLAEKPPQAEAAPEAANQSWFAKLNPQNLVKPKAAEGAAETMVLRDGQLVPESAPTEGSPSDELAGAAELYRRGEYEQAEKIYRKVAENTKNSVSVAEEARFYEAECMRRQERYPRACDTYHKVLLDFPSGTYREQAVQRMYDIANYWLEDTRAEMKQVEEKETGKRWFVVTPIVHFEKAKPFLDQEGRALEALERVRFNDLGGQLADKALFLSGSVKFYREDYRAADWCFTQLVEYYPNSKLAPQAVELGIIAKHMGTGGSDYDGRKVAEARQLINTGMRAYPTLAREKQEFLMKQLASCNMQQAEKDFKIAEFYRRTKHPGSAYYYYEIVRRRYPGTKYAEEATVKMQELHDLAMQDQQPVPPPPGAAVPPPRVPPPAPVQPGNGLEMAPPPRPLQ